MCYKALQPQCKFCIYPHHQLRVQVVNLAAAPSLYGVPTSTTSSCRPENSLLCSSSWFLVCEQHLLRPESTCYLVIALLPTFWSLGKALMISYVMNYQMIQRQIRGELCPFPLKFKPRCSSSTSSVIVVGREAAQNGGGPLLQPPSHPSSYGF